MTVPGDSDSGCDPVPPPRHRMAALTFVGLLAPVYFIPPVFQAVLPGHRLIGVMLSVASIVLLMTYAIMPALNRGASAWLLSDGQRAEIRQRRLLAVAKKTVAFSDGETGHVRAKRDPPDVRSSTNGCTSPIN